MRTSYFGKTKKIETKKKKKKKNRGNLTTQVVVSFSHHANLLEAFG